MSLQNDQRLIQYVGNGVTTALAIPFVFHANAHVYLWKEVISTGVVSTLALTTNYTLSGLSDPDGGTATLLVAPTSDERITIARIVPYEQLTDYVNNDRLNADVHERQMDLIVMQIQQLADPSDLYGSKALRFPITEPPTFGTVLPNANQRVGKILGFNNTTGEMVLFEQPLFTVTLPPPSSGTWVLGAKNGIFEWFATTNCA